MKTKKIFFNLFLVFLLFSIFIPKSVNAIDNFCCFWITEDLGDNIDPYYSNGTIATDIVSSFNTKDFVRGLSWVNHSTLYIITDKAAGGSGNISLVDRSNNVLFSFQADIISGDNQQEGVSFTGNYILMAGQSTSKVYIFNLDGSLDSSFSVINAPTDLAWDGSNVIVLSDSQVAEYTLSGTLITSFSHGLGGAVNGITIIGNNYYLLSDNAGADFIERVSRSDTSNTETISMGQIGVVFSIKFLPEDGIVIETINGTVNTQDELDDLWFNISYFDIDGIPTIGACQVEVNGFNNTMQNDTEDHFFYQDTTLQNGNFTPRYCCIDLLGNETCSSTNLEINFERNFTHQFILPQINSTFDSKRETIQIWFLAESKLVEMSSIEYYFDVVGSVSSRLRITDEDEDFGIFLGRLILDDKFIVSIRDLTIGEHKIIALVTFEDGTITQVNRIFNKEFDVAKFPRLIINSPLNNEIINGSVLVDFCATDDDGTISVIGYSIDNEIINVIDEREDFTICISALHTNLVAGNHIIIFISTDNFGNSNQTRHNFNVIAFPSIEVVIPSAVDTGEGFVEGGIYIFGDKLTISYRIIDDSNVFQNLTIKNNDNIIHKSSNLNNILNFIINDSIWIEGVNVLSFIIESDVGNITKTIPTSVSRRAFIDLIILNAFDDEPLENVAVGLYEVVDELNDDFRFLEGKQTNINGNVKFVLSNDRFTYRVEFNKNGFISKDGIIYPDRLSETIFIRLFPNTNISGNVNITVSTVDENNIGITSTINLISKNNKTRTFTFNSDTLTEIPRDKYLININSSGFITLSKSILILTARNYPYQLRIIPVDKFPFKFYVSDLGTGEILLNSEVTFIETDTNIIELLFSQNTFIIFYSRNDTTHNILIKKQGYDTKFLENINLTNYPNGINFQLKKLESSDFVNINVKIVDINNIPIIEDEIEIVVIEERTNNKVHQSVINQFITNGLVSIDLLKNINYTFIFISEKYEQKTIINQKFSSDSLFKVKLFIESFIDETIITDESLKDKPMSRAGKGLLNDIYFFMLAIFGGRKEIVAVIIFLITAWFMSVKDFKEKIQLIVFLSEFLLFIVFGLIPAWLGLLVVLLIAGLFSEKVTHVFSSDE